MRFRIGILFLLLICSSFAAFPQETKVSGKVTDANSGDPVPFANVIFQGTTIGVTTDFDGNFTLSTFSPTDTIVASYVGYITRKKVVAKGTAQVINFQLKEDVISLSEIVVIAGENPAWSIMRNVIKNKSENDKRKLSAYEYDTYTKIEIDVDNISDKFRERKVVRKITQVLDSVEIIAGEDGKPILPLFITESVSKVYYRDKPSLKKEKILKTKINGIGVEDGSTVTQFIGSSFQEYNFYENWLNIVTKEFVSPIADGWRIYYEYDLTDSLFIDDEYCYKLEFYPKSPQDLAFTGTLWITKQDFALKRIDASVGKQANVNFVEKIRIQQELTRMEGGAWLPVKNRVLIDIHEMSKETAGMLAKFYTSNKNFTINKPYDPPFYDRSIEIAEDARLDEEDLYWDTLRHEPLSETEKSVYKMIDTLRNIPVVKTYTDIIKLFLDGYHNIGKVELGPYLGMVAWNTAEGLRLQGGLKTTYKFSKKWIYTGLLAYGFDDEKFKYYVSAQRILSRERWTTLTFRTRHDIIRLGIDDENLADNPIFLAASHWGNYRRPYWTDEYYLGLQRELFKGYSQKVSFRYWTFNPEFAFGYLANPGDVSSPVLDTFQSSEVSIESRYARDELFIQNDNERISMGTNKWPVITLKYTHGFSGVIDSDFDFDKLRLTVKKNINTGPLGVGKLTFTSEYVFNSLPYPMLSLHLGNESLLYTAVTYNLMDFGEFMSDRFASVQYRQYLEGFLLNRIPLMNKLKWRLLATTNILVGGMRQANRDLIAQTSPTGETTLPVGFLDEGRPYVEVGYGIENIFKFLRVDFVHRVSYLDKPGVRTFGVLFAAQFQL